MIRTRSSQPAPTLSSSKTFKADTPSHYFSHGFSGPFTVISPEEAKWVLEEVCDENRRNPFYETSTELPCNHQTNSSLSSSSSTTTTTSPQYDQYHRFKLHLFLPRVAALASHPRLIKAVREVLYYRNNKQVQKKTSSDDLKNEHFNTCDDIDKDDQHCHQPVLLWSSDINIKDAESSGVFCPHQDSTYAGLSPPNDCLTVWIALSDPVGLSEGCLAFVPGSHRWGQLPHVTRNETNSVMSENDCNAYDDNINNKINKNDKNDDNMLSLGQFIPDSVLSTAYTKSIDGDELAAVSFSSSKIRNDTCFPKAQAIPLRAGQATFHSFRCVHSSGPNQSSSPRVGLALRYMAGHVVQTKPVKELVTHFSDSLPATDVQPHSTHPTFDWEPKLVQWGDGGDEEVCSADIRSCPLDHITGSDIQAGREVREEAMKREEANYFHLESALSK